MNKHIKTLMMIVGIGMALGTQPVVAKQYEVPPSSSTYGHVPYISDEAMEQCVILYNKAKDLGQELRTMYVDRYSQSSIDAYNRKVDLHSQMTNQFNRECAGKQSESAYRAAQKLNREEGGR